MALNDLGLGITLSFTDQVSQGAREAAKGYRNVEQAADAAVKAAAQADRTVGRGLGGAARAFNRGAGGRFASAGGGGGGGGRRDARGRFTSGDGGGGGDASGGGGFGGGSVAKELFAVDTVRAMPRAIASGLMAAIEPARNFQSALASLKVVSGATAEELKSMRDAAIEAGVATEFNPTEAANGMRELAAQGLTAQQTLEALNPTLLLASASMGELGVAESAGLASQAIKAFGLDVSQTGIAVDQMLKSANLFALAPKDLPLALGTAARGAQLLHQSLDETLISLGLVKNIMPSVERSSTATAVAMQKLVEPKAQKALSGITEVVDKSTGKFRPFLDILGDMAPKIAGMSEAAGSALLHDVFGAEALGGVQAILTQITNGVTTSTGQVLKGAEAIVYLRDQMKNAGGTAQQFADEQLKTLDKQMKLLRGSVDTLLTVAGDSVANALAPITKAVASALNVAIKFFQAMPEGMRESLGKIMLVVAGMGMLAASIAAAALAVASFGAVSSVLGVPLAPILLASVAIVGLGAAIIYVAQRTGIASAAFEKLSLFVRGLFQALGSGQFSGQVLDELNKVENGGIKGFIQTILGFVDRVRAFFRGIGEGFNAAFGRIEGPLTTFKQLIGFIGEQLGITGRNGNASADALDSAASTGQRFGDILSGVVGAAIQVVNFGMLALGGAIEAVKFAWQELGPLVMNVLGAVKGAVQLIVGLLTGDWSMAWKGAVNVVFGAVGAIMERVLAMLRLVARAGDAIGRIFGVENAGFADAAKFATDVTRELLADAKAGALSLGPASKDFAPSVPTQMVATAAGGAVPISIAAPGLVAAPSAVTAGGRLRSGEVVGGQIPGLLANEEFLKRYRAGADSAPASTPGQPESLMAKIGINLDGQKIAEAVALAQRSDRARAFEARVE